MCLNFARSEQSTKVINKEWNGIWCSKWKKKINRHEKVLEIQKFHSICLQTIQSHIESCDFSLKAEEKKTYSCEIERMSVRTLRFIMRSIQPAETLVNWQQDEKRVGKKYGHNNDNDDDVVEQQNDDFFKSLASMIILVFFFSSLTCVCFYFRLLFVPTLGQEK